MAVGCSAVSVQRGVCCAWDRSLPASTSQNWAQKSTGWLSSCFLEPSLAVIFFGKAWGQGNWVGWQMALNRKGGSVCLQTWRGVVPLLPGALDKNQCGSFLPATAAPHRCSADESTPTRERLRAPGAAPCPRSRRARATSRGRTRHRFAARHRRGRRCPAFQG